VTIMWQLQFCTFYLFATHGDWNWLIDSGRLSDSLSIKMVQAKVQTNIFSTYGTVIVQAFLWPNTVVQGFTLNDGISLGPAVESRNFVRHWWWQAFSWDGLSEHCVRVHIYMLYYSDYSSPVMYTTAVAAPSQPDPPMLSEQFVSALTVSWIRRPGDDTFTLNMDDESKVRTCNCLILFIQTLALNKSFTYLRTYSQFLFCRHWHFHYCYQSYISYSGY